MKKIFALGIGCVMLAASFVSSAQHTTPRFGTAANQNRTYSGIGLKTTAIADVALLDTVKIAPNAYTNHYVLTVTDTVNLSFSSIANSYLHDEIYLYIENTSGANHFVYFLGNAALTSKWKMASTGTTITLASAKAAVLHFKFNGTYWYEVSRCVQ